MYERESEVVRLGVEFLTALTEKDYLTDPSFDVLDLEKTLNEIQVDINFLISTLPVEAIDDDQEREEEYAGDFEDSEELEDEVVECERLIAQATKLMGEVREHYLPSEASLAAVTATPSPKPAMAITKPKPLPKPEKKQDIDWFFLRMILITGFVIACMILS